MPHLSRKSKTRRTVLPLNIKKERIITVSLNPDRSLGLCRKEIERRDNKNVAGAKFVSKDEAIEYCLPRYFDGSTCKRGHIGERQTANGQCLECAIHASRTPERLATKSKYHQDNRERFIRQGVKRQRERYAESSEYRAAVAARNMLKRVLRTAKNKKTRW